MTLPTNYEPDGLVPIVIVSDADGVEQYRFEHPMAITGGGEVQDFPMIGYHLHNGVGSDLGRLVITFDDRSNTWTDTTKGRRPSLFKPQWKVDFYMFLAGDSGNPAADTANASLDQTKRWFSGYVIDPQVERPVNNYQRQTLFCVGMAKELTERLTSIKRTQARAANGTDMDTTSPLTASSLVTDLITKTDHFPHAGLPALTNFNANEVTTSGITFADFHTHYYTVHQALQEIAQRAGYVWGVKPDGTIYMFPRGTQDGGLLFTNNTTASLTNSWDMDKVCILRNVPTGYLDSGVGVGFAFLHGVGGTTDFILYEQTSSAESLNLQADADFAFPFIPDEDSLSRIAIFGSRLSGTIGTLSTGNPANILDTAHGLVDGMTITISGSDSTPNIDGDHVITYVDVNNFTIPVNVTDAGTSAGTWVAKATVPLTILIMSDDGRSVPQTGSVKLTGGASGSVDGITVDGVQIMSGAESFDTDLETTGANVAKNINAFSSTPNYRATSYLDNAGDAVITIIPLEVHDWINTKTVTSSTTTITKTDSNMAVSTFGAPSFDLRRRIKIEPDRLNDVYTAAGDWLEYPLETLNSGTTLSPYTVNWIVVETHNAVRLDYDSSYGMFARNVGTADDKAWIHDDGALKVRLHHSHSIDIIVENTVANKSFSTRETLIPISDFPSEDAAINGLIGFSEVTSRTQRVYQPIQASPPQTPPELGKTARMIDKFNGMDTIVDVIGYDIQATAFTKWNRGVNSMTFHVEEVYYPE